MSAPLSVLVLALCLSTSLSTESPSMESVQADDGYDVFPSVPGSRYKIYPISLDWIQATYLCESDGGGSLLAVINSVQEAEVIKTLMARIVGTEAYVGINDIAVEGEWVTVQGVPLSVAGYAQWADAQPNVDPTRNCGHVHDDALYYDTPCSLARPFICEKPDL